MARPSRLHLADCIDMRGLLLALQVFRAGPVALLRKGDAFLLLNIPTTGGRC